VVEQTWKEERLLAKVLIVGRAMPEFLLGAATFILAMVALGLVRVLRGPGDADRMMAAQLLGTGGIAAVLLLGARPARTLQPSTWR
jgi:multisubunit Na+/H+ antiporter MnhF subunit